MENRGVTVIYIDWVVAVNTLLAMELLARKKWQGWMVGLVNQGLWAILIYDRHMWGMAVLSVILTWRYSIALYRWRNGV